MISSPFSAGGIIPEATPDDDADVGVGASGFRVRGTAGDVAIMLNGGAIAVIPECAVGEDFAVNFVRLMETGTTAVGVCVFTP